MIKKQTNHEARAIINNLNRVNLKSADYKSLFNQIGKLITKIPMRAFFIEEGTTFYRAVRYNSKPKEICFLGSPPPEKVTGYQRCNVPGDPMFYAGCYIGAVLSEIGANDGDNVYLSKWVTEKQFLAFRIPPDSPEEMKQDPGFSRIETFFETIFSRPVHETFSEQYKITSAIAQKLTTGVIKNANEDYGQQFGAVVYPSVVHPSRADNIAIKPNVEKRCLRLQDVSEICVIENEEHSFKIKIIDFSSNFTNDEIIWSGRTPSWTAEKGEVLIFTNEANGWVARRQDGTIVHPR
jgi:hypothetical protein